MNQQGNVLTRHLSSEEPRVMVVDGSKVARRVIEQVLKAELPAAQVIACESGAQAQSELEAGIVDLVTTALYLPDMDGQALARHIREHAPQAYIPIVVVSGSVNERLAGAGGFTADVTDYFDKSLGYAALAEFVRGYVSPATQADGRVLYVEDSRVVALATRRMLEKYGLEVTHLASVEEALALIEGCRERGEPPADVILTDVYLKGGLTGKDLLERVRGALGYSRGDLPVLVMTADDNVRNQAALLRAGANDLVHKPVEERVLMTKLVFQLRVAQHRRATARQTG